MAPRRPSGTVAVRASGFRPGWTNELRGSRADETPSERIKLSEYALATDRARCVGRTEFDTENRRLDIHLDFEVGSPFACAGCGVEGLQGAPHEGLVVASHGLLPAPGPSPRACATGPLPGARGTPSPATYNTSAQFADLEHAAAVRDGRPCFGRAGASSGRTRRYTAAPGSRSGSLAWTRRQRI